MNKIYKVVWNKARNCYVVASEFAKNHQTGSSRIKAASVAAVMAATMLTIGTGVIYAADVAVSDRGEKDTYHKETILYDNTTKTTGLNDPNLKHYNPSYEYNGHTDKCGELTYNTTLTIGDINKVVDRLVENDNVLYDQDIKNVTMENGSISLIRNDGSPVTDNIALTGNDGTSGQDTSVTVTVGDKSQTFQTGSVVTAETDANGKATGLTINGTPYDIKDTTYSAGDNVTIDNNDNNKISVDLSEYAKSDDIAVVYQDNDKNKSLHSTNAGTVGSSSIALGKEATTGMRSVALGDQTKATGEHSTAIGVEAEATALDSIAIGGGTKATGGDSIAIGNDTTANSQYSVAIGDDIHSTGYSATAVGQQAHATGNSSTALGAMTNVDGDWNYQHPGEWRNSGTMSTAIGYGSGSWGDYSTAIGGGYATAEGKFATAIGTSSQATAENAVALGGAAKANVYGGVALGTSSVADRAAGEKGAFAPTQINEIAQSTWISTQGAVSVGDTEKNITRQITHVAAGSEDTDAVNVAQLKQVNSKADSATETANKGWNLTTAHGGTTTVKPGDTVDFSPEDTNLTVTNEGTNVKIGLNKDLTGIESMTNGSSSIRMGNGGTVTINKVTIDQSGKISGVAAGRIAADSTDAINGSQLKGVESVANKGWNLSTNGNEKATQVKPGDTVDFSGDDNISVANDGTKVTMTLKKDLTGLNSAKFGDTTINTDGLTVGSGTSVLAFSTKRVSVGGQQIHDVADGEADMDAVNMRQLNKQTAASKTTVSDGTNTTVTSTVAEDGHTDYKVNLNKDLTSIESMTNGSSSIRMGNGGTVTINKVTIDQSGKISGVAAGRIAADSTDAINGSQLHAVQQEAGKHTKVVKGSNITVEETDQDGQKTYKVGLNKDLLLGDIPGKNVSISGTNGTIETTGSITTKDRVYADKGAKLADVDITGDTISNDKSSVKLDKEGTVTVNNKVTIDGNGKVSGVAAGDISDTSTDAVNGSQLYNETRVAKDGNFVKKSNTAGENLSALDNQVTANTESIYHMNGRISDLDNRVNKVGAGAAALAALHPLDFDPDAKWDFAAGYGNYRGANAAAVGAYYRPNEDTMFSVGGTFGNGENMVNAGVSFKLGSGSSHVSTSRVAMAKEIKELRGELEAMKSAMLDANAGKKIDTSKLQLFPDVPQNHWAYEYVAQLAGNGMIEGYPDGNFAGDRPMTRYEFAAILYRAMTKGAVLSDKILSEFSHELEYFTVDTIAKDKAGNPTIQRVRTVKENKNK